MRFVAAAALVLALAGCSSISEIFPDYPKQVAVLEVSLRTAEHAALVYAGWPTCGKSNAVLCSSPSVRAKIAALDEAAYSAVVAARQIEDQNSLQAAQTAVSALKSVTDGLPAEASK